jgi:group I intron endonuclease
VIGIYRITCLPNGKVYIGSSVEIEERWTNHRSELRCKRHANIHLQRAWNKHGPDAFVFEILQAVPEATRDELIEFEAAAIRLHKPKFNINLTPSKPPLCDPDAPGRKRVSEARKRCCSTPEAKAAFKARMATPEVRAKQTASNRARAKTPEHRARAALMITPEAVAKANLKRIGRKHSAEHREKVIAAISTPEAREKVAAKNRARVATPEWRAAHSEKLKASWSRRHAALAD